MKLNNLPLEMLETVLVREFLMLYVSDFDSDDDCRLHYGKSKHAESQAYTVLSPMCSCWLTE